jgi:hypothetical protein
MCRTYTLQQVLTWNATWNNEATENVYKRHKNELLGGIMYANMPATGTTDKGRTDTGTESAV